MRDSGRLVAGGCYLGGGRVAVVVREGRRLRWEVWDGDRPIDRGADTPPRGRRPEQALAATLERLQRRYGTRPAADGRAS